MESGAERSHCGMSYCYCFRSHMGNYWEVEDRNFVNCENVNLYYQLWLVDLFLLIYSG